MTLDFITRSEFVNLKLRRFKDDITYNETFSPYKGLFKLKVQNTNLFHTPLVLGLFIPPLGALIGIAYGIHGMATENLRRPKTTVVDNAVSTYGDRIYNTPYKGTASGVVRALEKFDTAEYFVKRKILRCMKKGRYKEAMSRFYMLNREQHISSREDRLVFGAMLMQAGKYDDAMNVFKGQVLNYEDLPDNPSVMTLSELSKIIDLDSRAKKAIDFFSQDFSLKNRSDIDQQTFMDTLDSLFTNSDSLDSRIYNGIISHELFGDSSTQKWNSIIRDIIASRQECTPGSANVIIYKGDSFKEQLVIKFGDADSFVKDAARTRRLEGIIKEYNDNIKHAPTFLVMPGVIRYNALKTHKPIGIFEVDGRTSYVSLMAPGTSFLTVGETVRSNFIDIYPLLMDSISFIHNHLSEDDAESEVNHAKIHSDLIEKPDLSRILQERGVSQEVIARFKDKLEEFLEYSDSRIESHPKVTNIDCYLENWISDQYASLVKIDNGTFRSAPPQMDLAQALDYSNFFTYKHQKSYLKDYLKKNKGKYSKKEFIEIYDHCCFYRGLKNIIMADRYIQRGGNSDRYMYHAVNCFYKASAALRRINKRESKQFKELENIMFDMYRTLRK